MLRALVALALSVLAWGQAGPGVSIETEERVAGPFAIEDRSFQVTLSVVKLRGAAEVAPGFHETVTSVQIKDASGTLHFERTLSYRIAGDRFEETTTVEAELLRGKSGLGLLLTYGAVPSAPLRGRSWQVLGMVEGKLVPFSPPLAPEGDLLGQEPGRPTSTGWDGALLTDVLNFRVWTGNFFVIVPVEVNWALGNLRLAYRLVQQCRMAVEADRKPAAGEASIQLFPLADEKAGDPVEVVLKKDSVVEFLGAEGRVLWEESEDHVSLSVAENIWLKVRINGKEGYLHSPEDFAAVGLPEAG